MYIVKYGATWCSSCRAVEENLKKSGFEYRSVDIDECEEEAEERGISHIPVIDFYDDSGKLAKSHVGLLTVEELKSIADEICRH